MKNMLIYFSIFGHTVGCGSALYYAWRLADKGLDGWGWMLLVAVLLGSYTIRLKD